MSSRLVSPKEDLLHRPYLIKKITRGGGGQKSPILRRHSLWTTHYLTYCQMYEDKALKDIEKLTLIPNPNQATVRGYY